MSRAEQSVSVRRGLPFFLFCQRIVAVHSHVKQKQEDIEGAVVHMFRFENDLIVELWDVGQAIPVETTNEHGIF